jgi:hypothetical protein
VIIAIYPFIYLDDHVAYLLNSRFQFAVFGLDICSESLAALRASAAKRGMMANEYGCLGVTTCQLQS